jgi:peptide methionine sulfoxide reductase msrA/msrB
VILHKSTELPFTGKYWNHFKEGTYNCRQCGAPLYKSKSKFHSLCGWPSFDQEIPCAVKRLTDADGTRTEILCAKCGAHLGHVFEGEHLTEKNTRHCVNSVSLEFIPKSKGKTDSIVFGGGCFWCTEAVFSKLKGVVKATPGYAGGKTASPSYEDVCSGATGHAEVVQIEFDPKKISLEKILEVFFKTHDPTTKGRQGSDTGSQYCSIILYSSAAQKKAAENAIKKVQPDYEKPIVTEIVKLDAFYQAEQYHQDYFNKNPLNPYCLFVARPKIEKAKKAFPKEFQGKP